LSGAMPAQEQRSAMHLSRLERSLLVARRGPFLKPDGTEGGSEGQKSDGDKGGESKDTKSGDDTAKDDINEQPAADQC
jgi:hypothetical protein